jgi:hypothetical protein
MGYFARMSDLRRGGTFSPRGVLVTETDERDPWVDVDASVALSWPTLSALLLSPDETEEKGEDSGDGQRRQPN